MKLTIEKVCVAFRTTISFEFLCSIEVVVVVYLFGIPRIRNFHHLEFHHFKIWMLTSILPNSVALNSTAHGSLLLSSSKVSLPSCLCREIWLIVFPIWLNGIIWTARKEIHDLGEVALLQTDTRGEKYKIIHAFKALANLNLCTLYQPTHNINYEWVFLFCCFVLFPSFYLKFKIFLFIS